MAKPNKTEEIPQEVPKKIDSHADKQLYWVFGVMIGIIVVFLIAISFKGQANTINYEGLKFQKEMFGNIPLYKYVYSTDKVSRTTGQVVRTQDKNSVIVYLRNNPKDLNVPVTGKIEYHPREDYIYLVANPDVLCEDSSIAVAGLSSFLSQNGFVIHGASSDEEDAKKNNLDFVTCDNKKDRMVLSLEASDKNEIVRDGDCYHLKIADCKILATTEKFIVQSILDAKTENDTE